MKIDGIILRKKLTNKPREGPSFLLAYFFIKDINLYDTIILSVIMKITSLKEENFINPIILVSNISVLLISFDGLCIKKLKFIYTIFVKRAITRKNIMKYKSFSLNK
jgi:hypothetical protein